MRQEKKRLKSAVASPFWCSCGDDEPQAAHEIISREISLGMVREFPFPVETIIYYVCVCLCVYGTHKPISRPRLLLLLVVWTREVETIKARPLPLLLLAAKIKIPSFSFSFLYRLGFAAWIHFRPSRSIDEEEEEEAIARARSANKRGTRRDTSRGPSVEKKRDKL